MKNCEPVESGRSLSTDGPFVFGPALAMLSRNGFSCLYGNASCRGVNDRSDFAPEYLVRASYYSIDCFADYREQKAIYDSIRRREIVLPEEHHGQLGFEYAWRELLKRSRSAGKQDRLPCAPV